MPEQTREYKMLAPTRDTHSAWTANDPIIPEGVLCIVKGRLYAGSVEYFIGDGTSKYSELAKFGCIQTEDGKIPIEHIPSIPASKLTGTITASQLAETYVKTSEKGAANGVATLGSDGKIPVSQTPSKILTAEPDADDLAEGEVAYGVEA